ncbi:PH domain-containing protein [Marinobacter sp. ELB17]|uniref:PH domain-containing protein n=1 Tax=Marinobacter sp. ELB17 TaxID=270374 RepID=UPI0000F381E1|nr:PH domain-containing protein [Marinobacter sp. ELB17]EAZ98180.1 hypothetical protein MELB17_09858 [Marinobacter sp. ELB17]
MALQINSYAASNLEPGEIILYQTRLHWITLLNPLLFCIVGLVVMSYAGTVEWDQIKASPVNTIMDNPLITLLPIGGLTALQGAALIYFRLLAIISTEISVTTRRVIQKTGLIWRTPDEIKRSYIEGCRIVDQSWLGQLLHYGTVEIKSISGGNLMLTNAVNPMKIRTEVNRPLNQNQTQAPGGRRAPE